MAMTKIPRYAPDGTLEGIDYVAGPGEVAVLTGPVSGAVTLEDGTRYPVGPELIGVPPEHVDEVLHLIAQKHVEEGHPDFLLDPERDDHGFVYEEPTDTHAERLAAAAEAQAKTDRYQEIAVIPDRES